VKPQVLSLVRSITTKTIQHNTKTYHPYRRTQPNPECRESIRNELRMAITHHTKNKQGLHVRDGGRRQNIFSLDHPINRISNGVKDTLRHLPPCSSNQAHRVQENGGRGRIRQEFFLRYNRQERSDFFEISINKVLEDFRFKSQIDGLWMRDLFLVLWNILDGDYAVAVF
jgi:hypothetical protein